jgi:hypothetical protein
MAPYDASGDKRTGLKLIVALGATASYWHFIGRGKAEGWKKRRIRLTVRSGSFNVGRNLGKGSCCVEWSMAKMRPIIAR